MKQISNKESFIPMILKDPAIQRQRGRCPVTFFTVGAPPIFDIEVNSGD